MSKFVVLQTFRRSCLRQISDANFDSNNALVQHSTNIKPIYRVLFAQFHNSCQMKLSKRDFLMVFPVSLALVEKVFEPKIALVLAQNKKLKT